MPDQTLGPRARRRKRDIARRLGEVAQAHAAQGTPVSAVPLDRLLAEADVPRSTFYVYFPDRTAVFRELLDELMEFTVGAIAGVMVAPPEESAEGYRDTFARGIAYYREHEPTYRLLAEVSAVDADVAEVYRQAVGQAAIARSRMVRLSSGTIVSSVAS